MVGRDCIPILVGPDQPFQPEAPKDPGPAFRTFTSANGKTLVAKVIAQFDDETYTFETPDGQSYRMARSSFCKSDRQWLEFWQPEFAIDLTTLKHDEALRKMGYAAIKTRTPEIGMVVEVKIGDADLKVLVVNLANIGGEKIQQEADGILGGDLLPRFNALLDFASGTLYLKP